MITFTPGYYGWLGNQMFQYAAVRALGLRYEVPISFPSNIPNLHKIFNICGEGSGGECTLYREPEFCYHPIPFLSENMMLCGYFQSEKYFLDFKDVIKKDFSFRNSRFSDQEEIDAISLHVRRGDYVKQPEHHPACSERYYKEALEHLPEKKVVVFSDDIEWCKNTFTGERFTFSEGRSAQEDLEYMSHCQHHIIANSSFSWWGAWLGRNEGNRVVAPLKWFGPAKSFDASDLYCEGWEVI